MLKEDDSIETMAEEKSNFERFVSQALRLHRKGSFEMLLAQHLAVAVASEPMQKIRLVCEAAYMVPKDKVNMDMQLIETIYLTCLSFLNTNEKSGFIKVAWGFPQTAENYARFIQPWHKQNVPLGFTSGTGFEVEQKREKLKEAKNEVEKFFLLTGDLNLHPSSLQMLKCEFITWAIPKIMEAFERLSRFVDPDLYKEMLESLKPKVKSEAV